MATNYKLAPEAQQNVTFTPNKMISFRTHLQPDPTYYFGNNIIQQLGGLIKNEDFDKVLLCNQRSA